PDPAPPESTGGGGFLGRLWRAVRGPAQRGGQAAGRAAGAGGGRLGTPPPKARGPAARGRQKNPPRAPPPHRRGAPEPAREGVGGRGVGGGGVRAVGCCLGNPALAGAVGGAALAAVAVVSQLPAYVLALFDRRVSNR